MPNRTWEGDSYRSSAANKIRPLEDSEVRYYSSDIEGRLVVNELTVSDAVDKNFIHFDIDANGIAIQHTARLFADSLAGSQDLRVALEVSFTQHEHYQKVRYFRK